MERKRKRKKGNEGHYQGIMPMDIGAIEGEEQAFQWVPDQEDSHGDNEWWTEEDYSVDGEWPNDCEDNYDAIIANGVRIRLSRPRVRWVRGCIQYWSSTRR